MAEDNSGDKLIWFLAGVAVGVAAGMLLAPRSGREIYEKGKDLAEDAAELFERGRKAVKL